MARLIPKIEPSDIRNSSERKVAEALVRQLPDSNIVIHSFNWTAKSRFDTIDEGECDCIVLDPDRGMLFIEVKGGIIKYLPDEGHLGSYPIKGAKDQGPIWTGKPQHA